MLVTIENLHSKYSPPPVPVVAKEFGCRIQPVQEVRTGDLKPLHAG